MYYLQNLKVEPMSKGSQVLKFVFLLFLGVVSLLFVNSYMVYSGIQKSIDYLDQSDAKEYIENQKKSRALVESFRIKAINGDPAATISLERLQESDVASATLALMTLSDMNGGGPQERFDIIRDGLIHAKHNESRYQLLNLLVKTGGAEASDIAELSEITKLSFTFHIEKIREYESK